jgi:transposase
MSILPERQSLKKSKVVVSGGTWVCNMEMMLEINLVMPRKTYPSDLTDAEWASIEPLLPAKSDIGHPREVNLRDILDGIFYVQREGCSWRALPGDFPPWQTVYNYFRFWRQLGLWQQIHDQLRSCVREAVNKAPQPTAGIIDSQTVKTTEKKGRSTATMVQNR